MKSRIHYDTHSKMAISRAKFDVCTCSSFEGVKAQVRTQVQTELRFICCLTFVKSGRVRMYSTGQLNCTKVEKSIKHFLFGPV